MGILLVRVVGRAFVCETVVSIDVSSNLNSYSMNSSPFCVQKDDLLLTCKLLLFYIVLKDMDKPCSSVVSIKKSQL